MSEWSAYVHKDLSDSGITVDADSAYEAAYFAISSYWFDSLPERRDELFRKVDEIERTITVVVYKPSASQSPTRLTGYKGTVTVTSTLVGEGRVSIQIEKTALSTC